MARSQQIDGSLCLRGTSRYAMFAARAAANALIAIFTVLCLAPDRAGGAETFSPAAVKAAFLYRFASYVTWPPEVDSDPALVIAIAGGQAVADELKRLLEGLGDMDGIEGTDGGHRRARLRRIDEAADLDGVHILYIGPDGKREQLLDAAATRPILSVTEGRGGLADGSVINFLRSGRNIHFEISLTAARRSRLSLGAGLLSVASRIEGGPQATVPCREPRPHERFAADCPSRFVHRTPREAP